MVGSVRGRCLPVGAVLARACSFDALVGMNVDLGGVGLLVAEPEGDGHWLHPGVEEPHCCRVTEHMG